MKVALMLLILALFTNCKKEDHNSTGPAAKTALDTRPLPEESPTVVNDTAVLVAAYQLALTGNALQLVNSRTGSTIEMAFSKTEAEIFKAGTEGAGLKVISNAINTECGAGPLKMMSLNNGLTIVLKKDRDKYKFSGWYIGSMPIPEKPRPTTMAGIGIGSTRKEIEDAYVIKVTNTSLGYEFSTTAGLFGIFDGAGENAKITDMWSGISCNFR